MQFNATVITLALTQHTVVKFQKKIKKFKTTGAKLLFLNIFFLNIIF